MKQYQDLLCRIMTYGDSQMNRTGIPAISVFSENIRFDLTKGFPVLTLRKIPVKAPIGEMIAFLKGATSAAVFREHGCKFWDQNANSDGVDMNGNVVKNHWLTNPFRQGEDDLGPVYGAQWRNWKAYKNVSEHYSSNNYLAIVDKLQKEGWIWVAGGDGDGDVIYYKEIDQIKTCVNQILTDPTNRRIIFHAWNIAAFDQVALPPCHNLYQFVVNTTKKELNLNLTIRSQDVILGNPSNVLEAAFLLELMARLTGYTAKYLAINMVDCHIYENHVEATRIMLDREPMDAPKLVFNDNIPVFREGITADEIMKVIDNLNPADISVEGYVSHPAIDKDLLPMAV